LSDPNYATKIEEKMLADESLARKVATEESEERKAAAEVQEASEDNRTINKETQPKFEFRSHMDSVRGLQFVEALDTLASISEDCTIKLWNLKGLEQTYADTEGNPEPYITLRGHTGPLLAITAPKSIQKYERVIFTAGVEGVIKAWNIPLCDEVNQYGDTFDGKNYCIGSFSDSSGETVWDLKHHPYQVIISI
jgi:WD40 repeat protein